MWGVCDCGSGTVGAVAVGMRDDVDGACEQEHTREVLICLSTFLSASHHARMRVCACTRVGISVFEDRYQWEEYTPKGRWDPDVVSPSPMQAKKAS